MSSVTDVFVLVGDTSAEQAETIAPKVAEVVAQYVGLTTPLPVISLMRDDWKTLQGGSKVAGSAAIWFGWNYADIPGLVAHLRRLEFTNLTVWSHHENDPDHDRHPGVSRI